MRLKIPTQKEMAAEGRERQFEKDCQRVKADRFKVPAYRLRMHLAMLKGLREGLAEFRQWKRSHPQVLLRRNSRSWLQREMRISREECFIEKTQPSEVAA